MVNFCAWLLDSCLDVCSFTQHSRIFRRDDTIDACLTRISQDASSLVPSKSQELIDFVYVPAHRRCILKIGQQRNVHRRQVQEPCKVHEVFGKYDR